MLGSFLLCWHCSTPIYDGPRETDKKHTCIAAFNTEGKNHSLGGCRLSLHTSGCMLLPATIQSEPSCTNALAACLCTASRLCDWRHG